MFSSPKRIVPTSAEALAAARRDVAENAAICRGVLFAARELVGQTAYGASLDLLLARAGELIDGIDDVLVALDPVRDAPTFAVAASLQRQLERLQASISEGRRGNALPANDHSRHAAQSCAEPANR
jgi:hypothetical protein